MICSLCQTFSLSHFHRYLICWYFGWAYLSFITVQIFKIDTYIYCLLLAWELDSHVWIFLFFALRAVSFPLRKVTSCSSWTSQTQTGGWQDWMTRRGTYPATMVSIDSDWDMGQIFLPCGFVQRLMYLTPSVMSATCCSEQGEREGSHHWCGKAWQSGPSAGVPGCRNVSQLTGQKRVLLPPCSSTGGPHWVHPQVAEGTQVGDQLAGDAFSLSWIW